MIRVESATIAPGQCAATGTSEGPFVDTLIDTERLPVYGRVYLSFDWVRTAGMMLCDLVPGDQVDRLQEKLDAAEAQIAELQAENDDLATVKRVLDDWKGTPMSRMPTPTELARITPTEVDEHGDLEPDDEMDDAEPNGSMPVPADVIESVAEYLAGQGEDTPGALADDDTAILLVNQDVTDDEAIRAVYGDAGDLASMLEVDPVPEKVEEIKAWIADADHPAVAKVRAAMAVEVEKRRAEKDQRPTVLALDPSGDDDADDDA